MAEPTRRWVGPEPADPDAVRRLTSELGLRREVAEILVRRGRDAPDGARRWLRPSLEHLHPPGRLPGMEAAADRAERALESGEKILVHGDYDADGMCAAALLVRGLRDLGGSVEAFVPHRREHGYDLAEAGIDRARERGAGLILTADCGTSAVEAVRAAAGHGIDVVVTDHHRPGPRLPDAVAVANPSREDSDYPFPGLSGTGVAFKLLATLWERTGRPPAELNQHLDLVAVGTVADVVPLVDENRALVKAGLTALARTRKPGLRALMSAAGWEPGDAPTTSLVGYGLGPRLNAVGRMAHAETGFRLLVTEDPEEARELAAELERQNSLRRRADREVVEEAEELLEGRFDRRRDRAVVLWDDEWHPGVIGIAASRIAERLHRPTLLITFRDGEPGRGSGRSAADFHLYRALAECAPLLERFGGHRQAAGFQVRRSRVEELAERFRAVARDRVDEEEPVPELPVDLVVDLDAADADLLRWIEHLAPFGAENPRPVLVAEGVRFDGASRVGRDGRHLKGTLESGTGARLPAIGFGLGERAAELSSGERWDVAFELKGDRWRGRERIQARVRDFRPAGRR